MIFHVAAAAALPVRSTSFLTARRDVRCYDVFTRANGGTPLGATFPPYLIHHDKSALPGLSGKGVFLFGVGENDSLAWQAGRTLASLVR